MMEQGYRLDVLDHFGAIRDYVLRIRGKIDGTIGNQWREFEQYQGIAYEVPLVWTIYGLPAHTQLWCSRRPVEHLFLQIRAELGFMDENPTLDRQAGSVGPKQLNLRSGSLMMRNSSNWSGFATTTPEARVTLDGDPDLFAQAERRRRVLDHWDR
jgi:hypothetical protein